MKKFIKKLCKEVVGYFVALLCILWFLGVLIIANDFVEWACADNFRFSISALVGLIVVIVLFLREVSAN